MNIIATLNSFANLGATWVMWVLVALSVVGLAIVIERSVVYACSRDDLPRLQRQLHAALDSGEVDVARHKLDESPSYEARIASAALGSTGADSAAERVAGAASLARLEMERNLAFLGTVGNNAPFVGLLGTVIGIVRAFHALNANTGQVSAGLMAEIGEALTATAIGLLVALPAVAFFNLFQRVIRVRLSRAEALCHEIIAHLKTQDRPSPA
ncbi:MAG: MotA/TolQ/ExbB proton channel family protein [Polyangiaceae bacterium]|nr:MotA/TolQ/ExbB proton channel family protein [Polyangiaceae bacterium]